MGLEYIYNKSDLDREFNSLRNKKGNFNASAYNNKIVLTYQYKVFYEKEIALYKTDPALRRKLIENRIKYLFKEEFELTDKELLRGFKISGIHVGFSHFSSLWVKAFIEKYNIKSIYDFCGGWGHRLLGSLNLDTYIYNDIDIRIVNNCKKIVEDFNIDNVIFYNNDSSIFTPKESYDCVFTCPPYFKTEKYNHNSTSINKYSEYEDWLNVWWRNSVKCSIKNCKKYFSFVVNNKYKEDMKRVCIEENLNFIEEIKVGKQNNLNHFQRVSNNSYKGEKLLVFACKK